MAKYNIKRRHSKTLDLSTGVRYRPLSRRLDFGGILDYNGEEKGLGWNKASGDALKSSFSDVGSAISSVGSVVGGVTSIVDSAMKNAQIADTSGIESDIQELKDETFSEATDSNSLLDAYNNINFQKADYTMQDVRGVSGGEMAMNTISAIGSGASAGLSVGGPWGCVCAGTRVITNDGRFVNIESLTETDGIVGYDKGTYCINDITLNEGETYKECVRITLSNGTILECSMDHPIYSSAPGRAKRVTIDGFRKRMREFTYRNAEDLQTGDIVAILDSIPVFGSKSEPDAYLIGMLIGDGSYDTKHGTRLFTGDPSTWKFIEDNYNCSKTIESGDKYQKEFRTYKITGFNRKLSDYGILGQSGFDKSLPQGIHEWDKESLSRFIAGLFDTDGYVTLDKPFKFRIAFCQSNYSLLSEVKELLLKFGIHSYIKKSSAKKTEYKGHAIKSKTSYVLIIKDILSTKRFIENISLNISYKKENLQKISDIIKIKKRRDNSYYDGIKAVKVRKIEPLGVRRIYNLEALSSHNYIANGIITHNSIAGAAVGLGSSLAGIFTGNSKARRKAASLNAAARDANNRAVDTFDYQANSVMRDDARNAMMAAYAKDGGAIHIKKKNRGKFTASAKRAGMGVQEFARHVLANKDRYSSTLVKRANFAKNFGGRKRAFGGFLEGEEYDLDEATIKDLINRGYEEDIHYDNVLRKIKEDSKRLSPYKISDIEASALRDSIFSSTSNYLTKSRAFKYKTRTGNYDFYDNLKHGVYNITEKNPLLLGNGFNSEGAEGFSSILKDRKLTPTQYAALMSHLNRESNYDYKIGHKGDNYEDYGAYQFTDSKGKYKSTTLTDYRNWLKENNKEDGPEAQTDFFLTQYLPKRKKAYEVWTNPDATLEDMTLALLEYGFTPVKEVREDENMRKRLVDLAQSFLPTYANGGKLNSTHGSDFSNGLIKVDEGGTHESNPFEGVPMGIAPDGQPNLVEEGEVIFNDYVFSNRLHPSEKELKEANLPKRYKGHTFALIAEDMGKESSERPNDPISKRGLEDSMMKLAMIQELQRNRKGKKGTQQMMVFGGRKYSGLVSLEDDPYEGSLDQALEEAELEWLARQDPQLWEELQAIGSKPDKTLPTYLRYAPALGSAIGALTSVVRKPDYSNSDLILNVANNLSRDKVRYRPINNYLTYKPLDKNYYLNNLQRQAGATRAALRNSGINPGQIMAGLLAADYNTQNAVGDTLMRMDMYNEQQRQAVEQFNRGTNQYNSQAAMNADAQNAQLAANRDRLRSQLITTAAGMREASDTALEQSRSMNFTNLMDNLGMIGRENRDTNMLETMKDSELFGVLNEAMKRGWNKDGGMLTKRRNRRRR